ncbi:MAG: PAS domain-containing protein, partial [Elusimicrobia bacterium]|nr:PAS domain-containing protein [Elusimicrobiota bacterium]
MIPKPAARPAPVRPDGLTPFLEAIGHAILAVDRRGRVARSNLAARALLLGPGARLDGVRLDAIFDPLPEELRPDALLRLTGETGRRFESRVRTPTGPRAVRGWAAPLKDGRRPPLVLLELEDMTEHRREQELAEWKAVELARSNAELEQFA